MSNNKINFLFILLLLALALRIIYVANNDIDPHNDMYRYVKAAQNLETAGTFGDYHSVPLYPMFLSSIFAVFGKNYLIARLIQALLSAFVCFLIYSIANKTFGKKAAMLSLVISIFYVDFYSYAAVLMSETLAIFIFLIIIYFLIKDENYILIGILFGALILTRAVFITLLPAIIIWIAIRNNKNAIIKKSSILIFFTLLLAAPWSMRNTIKYNKFVFLSPIGAGNIYLGHNPSADGGTAHYDFLNHDYGKFWNDITLSEAEKGEIAFKKAVKYMITHPYREFQLVFLKLSRYWSLRTNFSFYHTKYPLQKLFFFLAILSHAILYPLCLFGMSFSISNKNASGLTFIILNFTLVFITLFSGVYRFHFPLQPLIIIFAGYTITILPDIISGIKSGEIKLFSLKLMLPAIFTLYIYVSFIFQFLSRFNTVINILK